MITTSPYHMFIQRATFVFPPNEYIVGHNNFIVINSGIIDFPNEENFIPICIYRYESYQSITDL